MICKVKDLPVTKDNMSDTSSMKKGTRKSMKSKMLGSFGRLMGSKIEEM